MRERTDIELPDPFLLTDGTRVSSSAQWQYRRQEMRDLIVETEYGGIPPAPMETRWVELHTTTVDHLGGAKLISGRVTTGPDRPFGFLMQLLVPPGDGPFPVVLTGDACWRYATAEIVAEVLRRGRIFAQFNRVEIVPDVYRSERVTGLYQAYPNGTYGALAAWAWGYHRCVDVLIGMNGVDASRIAIVGHSRGGKTVLLAGATDERIALTGANNSGAGGAGCYRVQGLQSETLADMMRAVPYWFGPAMREYVGRENDLPFDQHFLKSLIAPRALLTTEALGDLWANPSGTWQTHLAAMEVYRSLGFQERVGIWFREGDHDHGIADWRAFLDFMDWQLCGRKPEWRFDQSPYPEIEPAFSWKAPRLAGQEDGEPQATLDSAPERDRSKKIMTLYSESKDTGNIHRARLLDQIHSLIVSEQKRADSRRTTFFSPDLLSPDAYLSSLKPYRDRFMDLLGWPLTTTEDDEPTMRQDLVAEDELGQLFRVWIQTLPQLETYGLLFVPNSEGPHALVISQHGGGGTPELCSNLFQPANYNDMSRRILRRNCAVFAPQLPMWQEEFGPPVERDRLDRQLKQLGGSVVALDIYQIRRSLDALSNLEGIDESRIGMMGLSWGGFYTLVAAALDTRIKVALTSCFFNSRYKYDLVPAVWFGSATSFLDAEIASLICPRPLYSEVGRRDDLFTVETVRPEVEKVSAVY